METKGLPTTRKEAQATGAKYYFTGEPCKHGHIAARKTKGACLDCLKVEWEKASITRAGYFTAYNKSETAKLAKEAYYDKNKEAVIARAQARTTEEKRQYRNTWKANNLLSVRASTKARRRKHRDATPPWITRKQKTEIRALYQIAMTMTKITGEQYVVDHIVPLINPVVCGLHVPWNLRVITQAENLQKSNKLDY